MNGWLFTSEKTAYSSLGTSRLFMAFQTRS